MVSALLVVALIVLLSVYKTGYGTICSGGVDGVSFLCPLGFMQMALASKSALLDLWLPAGLALLTIVLLGRFFCAWICPTALLRNLFGGGETAGRNAGARNRTGTGSVRREASYTPSRSVAPGRPRDPTAVRRSYSAYAVLGGALLSSLLFGFPVFCLVCPVGLFLGTLFAASRLVLNQQPGAELLVFPVLLALELVLLKRWCASICPLGALLTMVSRLNPFLRPAVRSDLCPWLGGAACKVCLNACPEGIYLPVCEEGSAPGNCRKCLECYEKCPAGAVELRWASLPAGIARRWKRRHRSASEDAGTSTASAETAVSGGRSPKRTTEAR